MHSKECKFIQIIIYKTIGEIKFWTWLYGRQEKEEILLQLLLPIIETKTKKPDKT